MTILARLAALVASSRDDPQQLSVSWLRDQQRREDSSGREENPAWDWDAIKQAARDDRDERNHEEKRR